MTRPKPIALIILDGFGYREKSQYNAIAAAKTPHWDNLWQHYPHACIQGSGGYVGLPDDQMGNSEVGHLNIGAGRIVYQDYSRINEAIKDREFFANPTLLQAMKQAKEKGSAVHILGLLSPGGIHSHEDHILSAIDLAKEQGVQQVYIHAFLDGRDTPPKSASATLLKVEQHCHQIQCGRVVSLIGRYYAMDRDKRWDRIQAAYELLTQGKAVRHHHAAVAALEQAYHEGESDEFIKASSIHGPDETAATIEDGDVVIFMNFRADRARQLSYALTMPDFAGFERETWPQLTNFVTLTQYTDDLAAHVAYPPEPLTNTLGEVLAKHHLKQLRIAETEKYAHVTFFFNGGQEQEFAGEGRVLIPSPQVATYDLQPQMSAREVTDHLVKHIEQQNFDVIICNFANPDMVGHTGDYDATIKAIETIDECLGRVQQALDKVKGEMLITADHGNAECMFDEATGQPHTAHTCDPVPLCYYGRQAQFINDQGKLSDIAPTLLHLLNIDIPAEMTGKPLLKLC